MMEKERSRITKKKKVNSDKSKVLYIDNSTQPDLGLPCQHIPKDSFVMGRGSDTYA